MKFFLRIALCCFLTASAGLAQRGGGGHGGGGGGHAGGGMGAGHSGGFVGGGGARVGGGVSGGARVGGGMSAGFVGGGARVGGGVRIGGSFNNGHRGVFVGGGGFRGFNGFNGFNGGFRGFRPFFGGFYNPLFYGSFGYGYSPYYYDYGYYGPTYSPQVYDSSAYGPMDYQQSAPSNIYVDRANPVTRSYDEYGQPYGNAPAQSAPSPSANAPVGSPVYLIAFADHTIRATAAYWVEGATLHYVTLEHEHKQVALSSVDRTMSLQLNRERHVSFALPAGQ